jgi:hypothetical protein
MFSLIITLISIALVAALALATLYYGGASWTRGAASANAATLASQGQQLLAALTLYYAGHSAYPATLDELVTGEYLKTVPVPPASLAAAPSLVAPALAAGEAWTMLAAGQPAAMVRDAVAQDVCQEVNYRVLGSDAVHEKADPTLMAQCYGPAGGPFTFVVGVPADDGATASLARAFEHYNAAHAGAPLPVVTPAAPANPVTVASTRGAPVAEPGPVLATVQWRATGLCSGTFASAAQVSQCVVDKATELYGASSRITGQTRWNLSSNGTVVSDPDTDPSITAQVSGYAYYEWGSLSNPTNYWGMGAVTYRDWLCPSGLYPQGSGVVRTCVTASAVLGGVYWYSVNVGVGGPRFASPAEMDAFAAGYWTYITMKTPGYFSSASLYKVCRVNDPTFCHNFAPTTEALPEN